MLPLVLIGGAIALVLFLTLNASRRPHHAVYIIPAGALFYGALVISGYAATAASPPQATPVDVPWGNLLVQLLISLSPAILGLSALAYAWIKSKLPVVIVAGLNAAHADTLLNRAVNQAIALTENAVKGKTLNVTIANQVIAAAAQFLAQEAPVLVKEWGPRLGKIIAGKLADLDMLGDDAHAGTLNLHPVAASNPLKAAA